MDAAAMLESLRQKGLTIWAEEDRLRVRPGAAITPEIDAALRGNEKGLLTLLAASCVPCVHPREDVVYMIRDDGCDWTL